MVKRAVLLAENPLLDMKNLVSGNPSDNSDKDTMPVIVPLKDEDVEKETIINALQICNGHREQAARLLKINPATLYRKMKKYGLR